MDRLYYLPVTVPAGTPIAAPVSVSLPLEDATLSKLTVTVPDGHNGQTGIRVLQSNQQVIPWDNDSYLVANDRTISVEFGSQIGASGIVIKAYNIGIYDHTFYVEVTISDTQATTVPMNASPSAAPSPVGGEATALDPLSPDALLATIPADATLGGEPIVGASDPITVGPATEVQAVEQLVPGGPIAELSG